MYYVGTRLLLKNIFYYELRCFFVILCYIYIYTYMIYKPNSDMDLKITSAKNWVNFKNSKYDFTRI